MKNVFRKVAVGMLLCLLAVMSVVLLRGIPQVEAASYEEECDSVFREIMEDIFAEENIATETVEVTRKPLYDIELVQLGYIYIMNYNSTEGYAVVINATGEFDVSEFYTEAENPYVNYDGQNVYVGLMLNLVWQNEQFFEVISGEPLDENTVEALKDIAFYSASNGMTDNDEVINYITKTENEFKLALNHPAYTPTNVTNACVPTAGGNLIGYYDRFHTELIPNFSPGNSLLNFYMYKGETAETAELIETLHADMGTNVTAPGTTIDGFVDGMTAYVGRKNLSISFDSCLQNGSFSFAEAKQKLENGLPLALFLDTYSFVKINEINANKDSLDGVISNALHAMAGFGYNEITYTLTGGQTRTDRYIAVATGLLMRRAGYFNVDYNTQIDECYAVNIF